MKRDHLIIGLLTALIAITILSCHKDNQTIPDKLAGRWEWIKTISPYTGIESNPQTSGFSQALVFSGYGEMQEYKNDVLINTSDYSIEIDNSNPKNNNLTNSTILNSHFYFESDTLIFSEAYVDGPVHFYSRK